MNEEMRKEFAEALLNLGIDLRKFKLKENSDQSVVNGIAQDYYDNGDHDDSAIISSLWYIWQASREAMKPIKLPDFNVFIHSDCWFDGESEHVMEDFDVNECRNFLVEAIKQAGYKVEE